MSGCGGPIIAGDISIGNLIKKCGKGIKLSQDLSRDEARAAMLQILDGVALPEQVGAMLVALRMKGESVDETLGMALALRERAMQLQHDLPVLLELASAHDGKNKSLVLSPFVGLILSACGVPVIITGGRDVPTKKGITARDIIEALGLPVNGGAKEILQRLHDAGFAYWDVEDYCPLLYRLNSLRTNIGLRTIINTIEKTINPGGATHVCTGVFHGPYLHDLAQTHAQLGTRNLLCVQATEASTDLPLKKRVLCRRLQNGLVSEQDEINPEMYGMKREANPEFARDVEMIDMTTRASLIQENLAKVHDALVTRHGLVYDALLYNVAVQLAFVGRVDCIDNGLQVAREKIHTGAMTRFFEGAKL